MSFINTKKVNGGRSFAPIRLGIGIFCIAMFLSSFLKSKTTPSRVFGAFFLIISVLITIKGAVKMRMFKDMSIIDSFLAKSEKNKISVAEMSLNTGISEKRVLKLIKKFIKKKYFHDVELDIKDDPEILLLVTEEASKSSISVTCPECGTQFDSTCGAVARCPECASIINI